MPCDTKLKTNQTVSQRVAEVRTSIARLDKLLASGQVRAKVGQQGAVAFVAWGDNERDGVTDNCAYRRIMATGSALAKAALTRAEQMAGRSVDRNVVGHGVHSHDGGKTWHGKG